MSQVELNGSTMGTALTTLLMADDIQPGSGPSYEICKTIYLWHPLGAKIVEKPVKTAQSQARKISVPDGPEDLCKAKFEEEWVKVGANKAIFATRVLAKVYGISTLALKVEDERPEDAVDFKTLWQKRITFNTFDPLNTAGSLVLSQDALSFDFQHAQEIKVQGATFHRSRTRVVMNEFPIFISYTPSAFGFVGRSAYQRALYALKSFVQTMQTDDLVSVKGGVIVAKMESPGSVLTDAMGLIFGGRRNMVREAKNTMVLSIGKEEDISSMNFQNLEGPLKNARHNILENIAASVPMPAKMLTEESFAEGFGEGTEDAKEVARFIENERAEMQPLYEFMDQVVMHRAWNPEWYKEVVQKAHPDRYGSVSYEAAFYEWKNSFKAEWPSLLIEPESEQVKVAEVKLTALVSVVSLLAPMLKGDELADTVQWLADNINEMELLFGNPLLLDYGAIAEYAEAKEAEALHEGEPGESGAEEEHAKGAEGGPSAKPKQLSKADSAREAIADFRAAVDRRVKGRRAA